MGFFRTGPNVARQYAALRDAPATDPLFVHARYAEELWKTFKCGADKNFLKEAAAPDGWWARYWEMYLFCALRDMGFTVSPEDSGPDVRIETDDAVVWVEAITPECGTTEDALLDPIFDVVQQAPERELILRYQAAILSKDRKFDRYRAKGWVKGDEPSVIAINASCLAAKCPETALPFGLVVPKFIRAVFAIGHPCTLVGEGPSVGSWGVTYQPYVERKSGARKDTRIFWGSEHAHVSAMLLSNVSPRFRPSEFGRDFVLVHNPMAHNPLPRGWLKRGAEYWVEDDKLKWENFGVKLW